MGVMEGRGYGKEEGGSLKLGGDLEFGN